MKYKWKVDRNTLTVAEYEDELPEFVSQWSWLGADDIRSAIRGAVSHALDIFDVSVLSEGAVEISKDHFELCLWVEDAVVSFWGEGKAYVAIVSFNLSDYFTDTVRGIVMQKYEKMFSGVVNPS